MFLLSCVVHWGECTCNILDLMIRNFEAKSAFEVPIGKVFNNMKNEISNNNWQHKNFLIFLSI